MGVILLSKAQKDIGDIARFYLRKHPQRMMQRKLAIILTGIRDLERQPISVGLATEIPNIFYWIVDITPKEQYLIYFERIRPDIVVYRVYPARGEPLTPEEIN